MFEDPLIEVSAFEPASRVFCIASAGCTALELARRGWQVSAVDVNPSQIQYVGRRLAAGPIERGSADRVLAVTRWFARVLGMRLRDWEAFVQLDDPSAQLRYWNNRLERSALRSAARALFSQRVLRLAYASPFVRSLPADFADALWSRLRRGIGIHPNRTNPFAWRLFLGRECPQATGNSQVAPLAELICGEATDILTSGAAGRFDGFSLSNILDGAEPILAECLLRAVRHAAAPQAVVVLRSFAAPRRDAEANAAAADRTMIWGRVVIRRVEDLDEADFVIHRDCQALPAASP
jgi:S-adenosylmethionine:diacylglycerol 3-amino-3-carboxypropyl transferase